MEHLTPNGKAGIIVPEGIIFQSANAYKSLRKMLIEQNYLYAVASLPAGVFNPYSGVKTSILFMDKILAKRTDQVLFVRIGNDGFDLGAQRRPIGKNDLPEAEKLLIKWKQNIRRGQTIAIGQEDKSYVNQVSKEQIIQSGYNLSGERYKQSGRNLGQKWPMVELGEICTTEYGYTISGKDKGDTRLIRITDIDDNGKIREGGAKYIDLNEEAKAYLLKKGDLLVARTGATYGKTLFFDSEEKAIFASYLIRLKFDRERVCPKFYWFLSQTEDYWNQARSFVTGGGQPQFNASVIKQMKIPLPPFEVQKELVRELNEYQKAIYEAEQVIFNYRKKIIGKSNAVWGRN